MTHSAYANISSPKPSLIYIFIPVFATAIFAGHCRVISAQASSAAEQNYGSFNSRNMSSAGLQIATAPQTHNDEILETDIEPSPETAGLPDAPGTSSSTIGSTSASISGATHGGPYLPSFALNGNNQPIAPLFHKYIEPEQAAQPLPTGEKILFGFHQLMSPYLLLTVVAAGGYEQAFNDSPNYGTDIGAYGQRVGAAAIRNASQTIFTDSIAAAAFHQDPRYYIMGNRRNAFLRAGYAITRVLVTRGDDGSTQPNYSLFSGYAGAAALTNAYYPGYNRGFTETAKSFGGSLGGAALSNTFREFLPNILHVAHLER